MSTPPAPPAPQPLRGAVWMLGSVAMFVVMSVAGRGLKGEHDLFEIMIYRSVIGLVVVLAVAAATRRLAEITTRNLGAQLGRNLLHFTGQWLWLWALMVIPLAQLFALEFTSPIWIILLAPFLLGEKLNRIRALATALGFAGILIVARPDFSRLDPGLIAAAVAPIFFALSVMMTKRMTRTEAVLSILFWQAALQIPMGLLALWGAGQGLQWPSLGNALLLLALGLSALGAHYCLAKALSLAPASFVTPVDFLRLPIAAVVGVTLYDEPVQLTVFLGAALIVLGNWINIRYGAGNPARSKA